MNKIFKIFSAFMFIMLSAVYAKADEKVIKIGTMAWEDLTPITYIGKKLLEENGYKVEVTEFSEIGIAYAAMTRGDVQIMVSQINYAAQDYWNKNKNRLEKISAVSFGLYQAIAVPSYVTIDSLEELNANADKFGNKIIGIEPGSGLMLEAGNAVEDYGLKLNLVEGSMGAMTAALKSAIDRKEWIAVATFQPHWMFYKYDVKFLKDPKGSFAPPQAYYWIGRKGFSEENPHVRELLASMYVPLSDINDMNAAFNDGKTMDQAVDAWVFANADLMKRWNNVKKAD